MSKPTAADRMEALLVHWIGRIEQAGGSGMLTVERTRTLFTLKEILAKMREFVAEERSGDQGKPTDAEDDLKEQRDAAIAQIQCYEKDLAAIMEECDAHKAVVNRMENQEGNKRPLSSGLHVTTTQIPPGSACRIDSVTVDGMKWMNPPDTSHLKGATVTGERLDQIVNGVTVPDDLPSSTSAQDLRINWLLQEARERQDNADWEWLCGEIIRAVRAQSLGSGMRWNKYAQFILRNEDAHEDRFGVALKIHPPLGQPVWKSSYCLKQPDLDQVDAVIRYIMRTLLNRVPRHLRHLLEIRAEEKPE